MFLTKNSWATMTLASKSYCKLNFILILFDLYQAVRVTAWLEYSCLMLLLLKASIH